MPAVSKLQPQKSVYHKPKSLSRKKRASAPDYGDILTVNTLAIALGVTYRRAYNVMRYDAAHLCGKLGNQRIVYARDLPLLRKLLRERYARIGKRGPAKSKGEEAGHGN